MMTISRSTWITGSRICYGSMRDTGALGLYALAADFASRGACEASVTAKVEIPEEMPRAKINSIRNHIKKECAKLSKKGFTVTELKISGGINPLLSVPQVLLTAAGPCPDKDDACLTEVYDGTELLLLGYPALEGMLRIVGERETELKKRFTGTFLEQIKACREKLCPIDELKSALGPDIIRIRQIGEGGIFAALWELAEDTKLGFAVDLPEITLLQETIEVCEVYRVNPYQLASAGSFLILAEDGGKLSERLSLRGMKCTVIGRIFEGNEKIIRNNGEIRYLDRPAADELYSVLK